MEPAVFESSTFSAVLAWLLSVPLLLGAVGLVFTVFQRHEGIPRAFSIWLGLCLLIFSPARYMLFQVTLATCYMVQSFSAFVSTLILAMYVPIVFGLLYAIGIGLPMLSLFPLLGRSERMTFGRGLLASVVLPVVCILSSFLFHLVLPYAGWTVHWLKARDVIRASNGPSAFMFHYFAAIGTPTILPGFFDQTPHQPRDLLRCHMAAVYLGDRGKAYFVAKQYPELFKELTSEASTE